MSASDGGVRGGRPGRVLLRTLVALALLVLAAGWVGPRELAARLAGVDLRLFAGALAVAVAANAVSAWRWAQLAQALDLRAPYLPLASAYAQGIAVNVLLPGATLGGDALRALRLAQLGNAGVPSALSVVLDRASGLWVLCVASTAATLLWLAAGGAPPAPLAPRAFWLYVAALALFASAPWWPWRGIGRLGAAVGLRRLAQRVQPWALSVATRRAAIARTLPLSLAVQLLSATALWLCALAAGGAVSWGATLAVAAPVFVAAALPLSIGGFGPRESAAAVAFALIGAPAAVGVAAALLYGLTAVVQGVLAAPLFALAGRRGP